MRIVRKVRAMYYDVNRGLFLVQTQKSRMSGSWTICGGERKNEESVIEGINRTLVEDTGLLPSYVAKEAFYREIRGGFKNGLEISAYQVVLEVNGELPSGNRYDFFRLNDLKNISLTDEARSIVGSEEFLRTVREICSKWAEPSLLCANLMQI